MREVGEAGLAQQLGADAGGVEHVREIGRRGRHPVGARRAGHDQVWILGADVLAVGETAHDRGGVKRIERHRLGSASEAQRPRPRVGVRGPQAAQLARRGAVQEREQALERLVGLAAFARSAAQESRLLGAGERAPREGGRLAVADASGGIGEAESSAAGEAEEIPQRGEP